MSGVGDGIGLIVLEELCDGDGDGGGGGAGSRNGSTRAVERFEFRFLIDRVVGGGAEEAEAEARRLALPTTDIEELDVRQCAVGRDAELAAKARSEMERSMRECLLRVLALRRRRRGNGERAENMSFKLCLHVAAAAAGGEGRRGAADDADRPRAEEATRDAVSCPELMRALGRGEWLQPEESSCLFSSAADGRDRRKGLLRPIKHVDLPSCGMKLQLGMEVDPFR